MAFPLEVLHRIISLFSLDHPGSLVSEKFPCFHIERSSNSDSLVTMICDPLQVYCVDGCI